MFLSYYTKHYKNSKTHLLIDVSFVLLIIVLIITNIYLFTKDYPVDTQTIAHLSEKNSVQNVTGKQNGQVAGESDKQQIQNTNLTLAARVVYYTTEGEQLGVGPWPPQVGELSSVRVVINAHTTLHSVKKAQIRIKLADKAKYTNNSAVNLGRALKYDPAKHMVVWNLNDLSLKQKAQASFEIEFTPSKSDLDQRIKLVKAVSIFGIDAKTAQAVSAFKGSLYSLKVK